MFFIVTSYQMRVTMLENKSKIYHAVKIIVRDGSSIVVHTEQIIELERLPKKITIIKLYAPVPRDDVG